MTEATAAKPTVVPRWLVRTIWILHRAAYSITGGRFGLRPTHEKQWGMLRLTSVGRKTGKKRVAIVGYIVDGPNIVVPAMNGWADPSRRGGSTSRRIRTPPSSCPTAGAR